ncbi:TetR/AcrR family transcriptional regulator [Actinomycetospora sp. CA-101289]|uniref:TetR/AcrR family transcriptional regulator n=1 Tax=Actinomycetospora sp. CA-101289 TaxID=3239893 RepID=UPI003D979D5D
MPRLWNETIEAHRRDVHAAVVDAAWRLVSENGLRSATMSKIAEQAGIGRATLYKYFPDVESILVAWHQEQVGSHLGHLAGLAQGEGSARDRLRCVLEAYALMSHRSGQHAAELVAHLHRDESVAQARTQVLGLLTSLLAEAAAAGETRGDVDPAELALYCLHALSAAGQLSDEAAVHRLVNVVLDAAEPPRLSEPAAATLPPTEH